MFIQKGMAGIPATAIDLPAHPALAGIDTMRQAPLLRHRDKDLIYAQGDRSGQLYRVEFGCIRVSRLTAEGRRLVTSFNFAGDVFGFEPGPERQGYAEAIESSGIRAISTSRDERGSAATVELLLNHFHKVQEHLLILGTQNATERVAAFLAELSDRQGEATTVRLPMSRSDIADHLGLTLETVSRAMHKLEVLGLLAIDSARSIRLRNKLALSTLGC